MHKKTYTIRRYNAADLDAVMRMIRDSYIRCNTQESSQSAVTYFLDFHTPEKDIETCKQFMSAVGSYSIVAEMKGEIVGVGRLKLKSDPNRGGSFAHISRIFGIRRTMVAALVQPLCIGLNGMQGSAA